MSDVQRALLGQLLGDGGRLFVVSNRGPITFTDDPTAPEGLACARGSGGLVTALADLGRHAPVTWIACALTAADRRVASSLRDLDIDADADRALAAPAAAADPLDARLRDLLTQTVPGQDLRLRLEALPQEVFEGYYEVIANPFLWFLQHEMYGLPYEPNVDRRVVDAWKTGYRPANRLLADAAVDAARDVQRPVFLLQDYHLYLAAERIRERRPDA